MKRHWRTLRFDRRDLVLGVRVEVEAEPLAVLAVPGAPKLDRELERLHERGRADHVVVVERAPAGVRVLVPEQPLRREQRRVLGQALPVHQQVLPVHVDLDVVEALRAELVDDVQRHPDVPHQDLHRRLGVLVLEEEQDPVLAAALRRLPDPVHEPRPRLRIGRLERVVVALDPGPDDEVRADLAGEVDRVERSLRPPPRASPGRGRRGRPFRTAGRGGAPSRGSRRRARRAPPAPRRGSRG